MGVAVALASRWDLLGAAAFRVAPALSVPVSLLVGATSDGARLAEIGFVAEGPQRFDVREDRA